VDLPQLSLSKFENNGMCFGCGELNPHSLKMKSRSDGDTAICEFIPTEFHQGWPGYAHGGALMAAIDESIGYATFLKKVYCVTAEINVRLKSMASLQEPLTVFARVVKQTSRTLEVEALVKRQDGSLVAEASSIQYIVKMP
jgi:acyl-coenzyme A thioesterase PaaI-like protein